MTRAQVAHKPPLFPLSYTGLCDAVQYIPIATRPAQRDVSTMFRVKETHGHYSLPIVCLLLFCFNLTHLFSNLTNSSIVMQVLFVVITE